MIALGGGLLAASEALAGWHCIPSPGGEWQCNAIQGDQPPTGKTGTSSATTQAIAPKSPAPSTSPAHREAPRGSTPHRTPARETGSPPAPSPSAAAESRQPSEKPELPESAPQATASPNETAPPPPAGPEPPPKRPRQPQATPDSGPAATKASWFPDLDRDLQWQNCRLRALPPLVLRTPGDVTIGSADAVELAQQNSVALFRGHVRLEQPDGRLLADRIDYHKQEGHVISPGPLYIEQPQLRVVAGSGDYYPEQHRGTLERVDYRLLEPRARGTAGEAQLLDPKHGHFNKITYTTCPPGNNGFQVHADEMTVDRVKQEAVFKNARLDLLGVPIFYSPWLSLPLTDARKSGFLPPKLGLSSSNGWDLTLPYYFNLAPNYDATLMPRIVSERGLLVGGEFRFLLPPHNGIIRAEILPSDRSWDGSGARGAFHAQTRSNFSPNLYTDLDLNWVSDKRYLRDLGQSLAVTSTSFLRNRLALEYHQRDWDLVSEVRHYQTLDEYVAASSRPYSLLPRVNFRWERLTGAMPLDARFNAEFVHFQREDSTTGQRIDLLPHLGLPLRRPWGYLEPAVDLRYTTYNLQDQAAGLDPSPDRFVYTASIDGGLYFDRPTQLFGTATTVTLEPRAFYVYTPYRDQDDIPRFDTGLLDFTFDNLFRGNRFNGPDRVGDANQLALALTSRIFQDASGQELLRASIGQIFYFEDRRVRLDPADPPADQSSSSLIAEAVTEIFPHWLLRAGIQYDPHNQQRKLRQGLAQATWHGEDNRRFHVAWRLREALLEQTDIAAIWPVSERLSLIGRWYYSVQEERTVETVGGLEYNDCCWRVRSVLRRFLDGPGDTYNTSIFFELELKGLGVLGDNIDRLLDRTIYGY